MKRMVSVVGGTVLAVIVAFGGGAVLSQFSSSTVAQTSADQISQVATQSPNPASTPVITNSIVPAASTNTPTVPASSAPSTNTLTVPTTPAASTNAGTAPAARPNTPTVPAARPNAGTGATNANNPNPPRARGGQPVGAVPAPPRR